MAPLPAETAVSRTQPDSDLHRIRDSVYQKGAYAAHQILDRRKCGV